jgi:hypothetical protein
MMTGRGDASQRSLRELPAVSHGDRSNDDTHRGDPYKVKGQEPCMTITTSKGVERQRRVSPDEKSWWPT